MNKIWVILLIAVLYLFSTLRMTETWKPIAISLVYMSLLLIMVSVILLRKIEFKYNAFTLFLIYLFFIFGVLSALVNQDIDLFILAVLFVILFFSTNIFLPSYFKENTEKYIVRIIIITHLPLLLIPVVLDGGISGTPYYGIFNNPNALAGATSTVLTVFFAMFFKQVEEAFFYKNNKKKRFIVLSILLITLLMLLLAYTSSRTSFIASLVTLSFGLILVLVNMVRYKKIGNILVKGFFILPSTVLLYFVLNLIFPLHQSVAENIVSKFDRKSDDVLDGRSLIWNRTFEESGFFGQGSAFFSEAFGMGSHSTFVYFLGTYGWIPFVAITIFFLTAFYYSMKQFFNTESKYKYLAPLMLTTFFVLSMAEDMNYKLSIITCLTLAGVCMNRKKVRFTKQL